MFENEFIKTLFIYIYNVSRTTCGDLWRDRIAFPNYVFHNIRKQLTPPPFRKHQICCKMSVSPALPPVSRPSILDITPSPTIASYRNISEVVSGSLMGGTLGYLENLPFPVSNDRRLYFLYYLTIVPDRLPFETRKLSNMIFEIKIARPHFRISNWNLRPTFLPRVYKFSPKVPSIFITRQI